MTNKELQNEITRLKAQIYLHEAQISALYLMLAEIIRDHHTLSSGEDPADAYIRLRKELSHQILKNLEDINPQLSAEILSILDNPSQNYPI
jgi:hypothetical protein